MVQAVGKLDSLYLPLGLEAYFEDGYWWGYTDDINNVINIYYRYIHIPRVDIHINLRFIHR
jgi:hypothetical protein